MNIKYGFSINEMHSFFLLKCITFILLIAVFDSCTKKKEIYYCPMHPSYTADRPGTCPICNMNLVKLEKESPNKNQHEHQSTDTSPINKETNHSEHNGMDKQLSGDKSDSGELSLSLEKQQSIGIRTDFVKRRNLTKSINIYSNVAYDPELYNALVEYKSAKKIDAFPTESSQNEIPNLDLRLRQLGLAKGQIRLWTSGHRDPSELILGGLSGRGHIYSQIYEADLRVAKVGLPIKFITDVYPDIIFKGSIKSIDTILDKNSRTLRLRSEVSDRHHLLKPQMFGQTILEIPLHGLLSLPTSAILDTGDHKIAYVKISSDRFKAVMITTGLTVAEWTEVTTGVKDGDEVVTESTFLIDSEAKIKFGNQTHNH